MLRLDSPLTTLVIAAAIACSVSYAALNLSWSGVRDKVAAAARIDAIASESTKAGAAAAGTAAAATSGAAARTWAASAAGRVEPRTGEVRISPQAGGRIVEVGVAVNDVVMAGDLLVVLADEELRTRLAAAEAEAAVRRRERDQEVVKGPGLDRRAAEDAVFAAERALFAARQDRDDAARARRASDQASEALAKARDGVAAAEARLGEARAALRKTVALATMPLPTRLESSLVSARAEVALAEAAIDRTRVRAPEAGTVLQLHARLGESVAPTPENVLVVIGDVSALRVTAEVEARDATNVRTGQKVVVRGDAYPGREFNGVVSMVAQSLAAPRQAQRGPRRPNDVEVLEVRVDLDGRPPLLPGMRVDVFFSAAEAAAKTAVVPTAEGTAAQR